MAKDRKIVNSYHLPITVTYLNSVIMFNFIQNGRMELVSIFNFEYFPISTSEDVCWTSLGLVILAIEYLPQHPWHSIVQQRHGSDVCEETFRLKRNASANADKKGTDGILTNLSGRLIGNLTASRKSNIKK